MTDDKHGPASFAATAFAPSPPPAVAPITNPGAPQSGVGPTAGAGTAQAETGPIGRTIHGRYKIKRLLGEGGMGGVYEGEHLEIGKRVAIKLVHALHARDPHIAARIKQEARSTGAIESENIVQVFDAGEDPELGIFLVMELLKGEDLGSLLARKKHVSPMAAATMVMQAAQGLSRAHAAGIVHRDLKPANIFLCTRDDGSSLVKLVDFGIAKLVRDANQTQNGAALTRMGMVIGTPQYMSPEQAQGLLTVDHRTDVYSLGAVLFEAMVGKSPYLEMPTYEQTILQIMTRPAPRLSSVIPDVHPELDRLCADMMAHDPSARPRDMAVVRDRLLRIFPQLEGGRLPMRSLTNEVGFDATVAAGSEDARAQVDAALARAGLSGVGLAVPRPAGTQPAFAATAAAPPAEEEPVTGVAGVPTRKNGALIGAVALLALAVGIGVVALAKMHGAAAPPAQGSFGLVQSTVSVPAATAITAVPTAEAPKPSAPPPAVAQAPVAPSVVAPAPVPSPAAKVAATEKPSHSRPAKGPAEPAPSTAGAKKETKEPGAAPPVGGTSESTEF